VVKSEDIPAATQLFTPNWIVKYMVQNSLGLQWVATYPNSPLKEQMEFFIEPAEQTFEVQDQLEAITPDNLNPEELTLLDPACGSGHILVEAYDLLKAIYQERGYRAKDIPCTILEKNLYGLEIDDRAAQLAAFALMMKARADDRHIFENGVRPHVLSIQESKGLDAGKMTEALNEPILKVELLPREFLFEEMEEERAPLFSRKRLSIKGEISQADVAQLIDLFEHGKTFGSLIRVPEDRVPEELAEKLPTIAEWVEDVLAYGDMFGRAVAKLIRPIIEQAQILSSYYDVVVTNPPYMKGTQMPSELKKYTECSYPLSKANLFACFIERALELAGRNGLAALITLHGWMFTTRYDRLRGMLLDNHSLVVAGHLGAHAFDTISGEVVQTAMFVLSHLKKNRHRTVFHRLVHGKNEAEKRNMLLNRSNEYVLDCEEFLKIEGAPMAFWLPKASRQAFAKFKPLRMYAEIRAGLQTGDNVAFLRYWHEVDFGKIGLGCKSRSEAVQSAKKWFPHNKGGGFRKWYGNTEYIINWENDGAAIKERKRTDLEAGRITPNNAKCWNQGYYFINGFSWSALSTGNMSVRDNGYGFLFDTKGQTVFPENTNCRELILGFLNSRISTHLLEALSPTLDFNGGTVGKLPLPDLSNDDDLKERVGEATILSRDDWNSNETSWDFENQPLMIQEGKTLKRSWVKWQGLTETDISRLRKLEERNNSLFLGAYELDKELSPEVLKDEITLYRSDQKEDIKRLISYAIGCMMGRYSLDNPGLIYAHSQNKGFDPSQYKTFPADMDGIIPITDTDWFPDDAANRVVEFIAVAWPQEYLQENLKFVAESLGPNRGESPRDTLRRYLFTGFYKHHLSIYKRRPIYWLFSSGKQRAFQCLVYLHRYNEGTLSRMRTEYVIPLQGKINARIDQLKNDIHAATSTPHRKKLEKECAKLVKQQAELQTFDEKLRHYADQRISLDLDDGVKVNYGKFGDLLAEVKAVTGKQKD
jgi:hypothetical protein